MKDEVTLLERLQKARNELEWVRNADVVTFKYDALVPLLDDAIAVVANPAATLPAEKEWRCNWGPKGFTECTPDSRSGKGKKGRPLAESFHEPQFCGWRVVL
jgi:hypothetical protein